MSSVGRPVPWCSWRSWQQTYRNLISQDAGAVQNGLDKVAAWRCRGKLPLSVDALACLVSVQMRDPCGLFSNHAAEEEDDAVLRMQYAMVIIRLVNGVADSGQKSRTANSVATITAAAGLPRALVDLRHEATHNELPSLPVLRSAAVQAISWLRNTYWERQEICLQDAMRRCAKLLRVIVHCQRLVSQGDCTQFSGSASAAQERLHAKVMELKSLIPSATASLLAHALLQPSVLQLPYSRVGSSVDCDDPPKGSSASSSCPNKAAKRTISHGERQSVAGATSRLALLQQREWQAVMQCLQREWPSLPGLCLHEAVKGLLCGDGLADHFYGWVSALHASASIDHKHDTGRASNTPTETAPDGFCWQPQSSLLTELSRQCLDATSCQSTRDNVHKYHQLLPDVTSLLSSITGQNYQAALPGATIRDQPKDNHRWQVVHDWRPCAIGSVPSVHDPNGASHPFQMDAEAADEDEILIPKPEVQTSCESMDTVTPTGYDMSPIVLAKPQEGDSHSRLPETLVVARTPYNLGVVDLW